MSANKSLTLASVPVRLAAAAALVAVAATEWRVVAAVLLAAGFALGLVGIVAGLLTRKAFRMRARMKCPNPSCAYRPLRIARICPACHAAIAGEAGTDDRAVEPTGQTAEPSQP